MVILFQVILSTSMLKLNLIRLVVIQDSSLKALCRHVQKKLQW